MRGGLNAMIKNKLGIKKSVELKFCDNPFSKMYHNLAFPLGIIQANAKSDITPWLCGKYTNCFFLHKDNLENMFDICVDDKWAINDGVILRQKIIMLKEFYEVLSIDYIELLKNFITIGCYPYGDCNEEFILGKVHFGKQYFEHDYLLYGYDDNKEVFYSVGYLDDNNFQKYEISYQNMRLALNSWKEERPFFVFFKFNEKFEFEFNIAKVKNGISNYLNSKNDAVNIKYKYVGMEAIEKLALYMTQCIKNGLMIDLRYTRGIVEHKFFMRLRVKYLLDNGYIMDKFLLECAEEIYKYAENIHMLGIKYNISKNKNIAGSILSTISIMLEKESKYLNILIQSLTC